MTTNKMVPALQLLVGRAVEPSVAQPFPLGGDRPRDHLVVTGLLVEVERVGYGVDGPVGCGHLGGRNRRANARLVAVQGDGHEPAEHPVVGRLVDRPFAEPRARRANVAPGIVMTVGDDRRRRLVQPPVYLHLKSRTAVPRERRQGLQPVGALAEEPLQGKVEIAHHLGIEPDPGHQKEATSVDAPGIHRADRPFDDAARADGQQPRREQRGEQEQRRDAREHEEEPDDLLLAELAQDRLGSHPPTRLGIWP
jgi:hypothetical protein